MLASFGPSAGNSGNSNARPGLNPTKNLEGAALVVPAEAVLLGDARKAERLTGKAAAQNVELRDVLRLDLVYVAMRGLAEVGGVGLAAELVPVAGEDAPRARPLEGDPEPADAAEEVDEAQGGALTQWSAGLRSGGGRFGNRRSGAVGRRVFLEGGRAVL